MTSDERQAEGMNRWEQSSAGSTQVSAKVPEPLKAEFKQVCEENGSTQTDVLKAKMMEYVRENGGTVDTPLLQDDLLADGYAALRERADPDTYLIDTDLAESAVAENTRIRAKAVRRRILDPLKRRGVLSYEWGRIVVWPPEEVRTRQGQQGEGATV